MRSHKVVLVVWAAAYVAACGEVSNTFIVDDPAGLAQSADLKICGKSISLPKVGRQFTRKVSIGCEGEGGIQVRMGNGAAICRIGYVTPGAEQTFRFTLEGGQCRKKLR